VIYKTEFLQTDDFFLLYFCMVYFTDMFDVMLLGGDDDIMMGD
jgi:hypothetical protein